MRTYLIEISAYDTGASALTVLRFSSQPYLHSSAPGYYANRVTDLPTFRRDIFSRNTTGGAGAVSQGDLIIANPDGELDNLRDFGLAGQTCTILLGEDTDPYSSFVTFIVGRVEQAFFDLTSVRVRLKDRLQDLQQPIQPNKYLGNNVLPNGLEGVDDLKGKPKPTVAGQVSNATPPLVNTSRLIYQVQEHPIYDVPAVRDAGALLTQGADYTSQTDMETTAPSPGGYRVWKAGGYFRLGSSPVGTITADVLQGANVAARTAAQVAQWIVTGTGGIPSGDVDASDVAALDAANSSVVGIWADSEVTFAAMLDEVLGSVGAWYGFDAIGKFRMQRVEAPSSPVATLRKFGLGSDAAINDLDIVDCRFVQSNDPDRGVPTWRVSLDYARNYTVQTGNGLAGSVTDAQRSYLGAANRTVISSDASVQTPNPLAVQRNVSTLLVDATAAQTEADRLLALYKVRRDFVEIDTPLTPEALALLDLGMTVSVVINRFGYDTGRDMVITGMEYNSIRNILILALWG